MSEVHMAGDIFATTVPQLIAALSDPTWKVRDGGDELEVLGDDFSIAIYDGSAGPKPAGFLVSAFFTAGLDAAKARAAEIGGRLEAGGIRYQFELSDPALAQPIVLKSGG